MLRKGQQFQYQLPDDRKSPSIQGVSQTREVFAQSLQRRKEAACQRPTEQSDDELVSISQEGPIEKAEGPRVRGPLGGDKRKVKVPKATSPSARKRAHRK